MSEGQLIAYLFVVDSSQISLNDAISSLDKAREIENWSKILPDGAILVSKLDVKQLHALIKEAIPNKRYLVTALKRGSKEGWLPKTAWEFMNYPKSVFKD